MTESREIVQFQVDGKVYDMRAIDTLSLKHILAFNRESLREGYGITWGEVEERSAALGKMSDAERRRHPDTLLMLALAVYASRLEAGEQLTFEQAIDFELTEDTFIASFPDHREPAHPQGARPTKQGSGRAAAARKAPARRTSART